MSQEYSSDSAMSPSGSSQTSSSSQNTPCKVTMYSPISLMASGANTPVKVTPSNTPTKTPTKTPT